MAKTSGCGMCGVGCESDGFCHRCGEFTEAVEGNSLPEAV